MAKGHCSRIRRDGDRRNQREARSRDHLTGVADLEVAVARIRRGAVWHLDLEKTVAHDRQVERRLGVDQVALQVQLLGGIDLDTGTQHQAGG